MTRHTASLVITGHDATRKSLIRFSTPDDAYVAGPEANGITTIMKIGGDLES
jgi:hypothetical protein